MEEDDEYDQLYDWLNSMQLSRQKRNVIRDFSDGVLMAEILKAHYPRHVDLHNYSMANSYEKKLKNWEHLNKKVLTPIGIPQSHKLLKKIAACSKGAIEEVLIKVKKDIENSLTVKRNEKGEIISNTDSGEEISLGEYNKLKKALKNSMESLSQASNKVKHLESLLELKNQRIQDLNTQLNLCHCQASCMDMVIQI